MTETTPAGPGRLVSVLLIVAGMLILAATIRQELLARRLQPTYGVVVIPSGRAVRPEDFLTPGRNGASRSPSWNVSIRYEYVVDGRNYRGHLVGLNGNSFGSEEHALESLRGLKPDGNVQVWYDKDEPSVAFLDPAPRRGFYLGAISCFLLAAIAKLYLDRIYYYLRRK